MDGALALSVAEVTRSIRCSERHVYNMVRRGELPSFRLGKRILIPAWAITELVERGHVSASTSVDCMSPPIDRLIAPGAEPAVERSASSTPSNSTVRQVRRRRTQ
jgi:excisionase family DNA binding protein